ncbi:putative cell survival pathways protein, partial [Spiromyces aspiralis]
TPAIQRIPEGGAIYNSTIVEDFAWKCKSTGSETQTFYFHLGNKIFGFIQIAWGYIAVSPTIQSNALFYVPGEGNFFETHNGHKLKVGDDGVSSEVHKLTMKWDSEMRKLVIDYNAGKTHNCHAHIEFERTCDGYKIGDGDNIVGGGIVRHCFYPVGRVKANMIINGKPYEETGNGLYIHAVSMDIMPYNVGQVWSFCDFSSKDVNENPVTFQLLQYLTPAKFGETLCTQAALQKDGKTYAVMWDNSVEFEDRVKNSKSGYDVPQAFRYRAKGQTLEDKKKVTVTMESKPDAFFKPIEVLHELPYFVKIAVQTLITNPFIFQWFESKSV